MLDHYRSIMSRAQDSELNKRILRVPARGEIGIQIIIIIINTGVLFN